MRKKIKKEHILLAGIIFALVLALGQLGRLIYKAYSSSTQETDYIELRISEYENGSVSIFQSNDKLKPVENNVYKVSKGSTIRIECEAERGYGIRNVVINEENQEISDIRKGSYSIAADQDLDCKISIEKVYTVDIRNVGQGSTKIGGEEVKESTYFFAGDTIEVTCNSESNNRIKSIIVNGKKVEVSKEDDVEKYTYKIEAIEKDCSITVEYEVKKYAVKVSKDDRTKVTINGVETNELIVEAGSDVKIEVDCIQGEKYVYIAEMSINDKYKKLGEEYSPHEDILISSIDSKRVVNLEIDEIYRIGLRPQECFEILDENGEKCDYKIVNRNDKVIYCLNSKKNIYMTATNRMIRYYYINIKAVGSKSFLVNQNTTIEKCVGVYLNDNLVVHRGIYAYPIYFIFDTEAPDQPTYTLSHSSRSQVTLTTTIHDAGESGIDTVQFGTKEDYEEQLAADETEKKYQYKLKNTAGTTYKISFDKDELSKKEYYIWATDNAGNSSKATKVDLTGPEITVSSEAEWTMRDVSIEGICKDQESGISRICYTTSKEEAESHYYGKDTSKVSQTSQKENGSFAITCKAQKSGIITYYIWGYDTYGNKSEKIETFDAKIDMKAPVISLVKKVPSAKWTNQEVTIAFTAKDKDDEGYSGVEKVYYSMDQEMSKKKNLEVNEKEEEEYVIQTPKGDDGKAIAMQGYYYIYASDLAGNISKPLKVEVNIDMDAPKPSDVQVYSKQEGDLQVKKYGIFSNQSVQVKVLSQDSYIAEGDRQTIESGTKEIALLCDGKQVAKQKVQQEKDGTGEVSIFPLTSEMSGELSVVTYDIAGNVSKPIAISKVNPKLSSYVCLELGSPKIKVDLDKAVYRDGDMGEWYAEHQPFTITIKDDQAGIGKVEAVLNGVPLKKQSDGKTIAEIAEDKKTKETSFVIESGQNGVSEDGHYTLELTAYDNAGNVKSYSKTIYIDDKEPVITKFAFEANGLRDHKDKLVEKMDYGYFFNGSTKVTVSASDSAPSSGIKEIEYYLVDYGKNKEGVESKKKTIKTDSNGNATFVIDKQFKGKICARALDYVENTTAKYAKPYGIVIDSSTKDDKNSQIAFTAPDTAMKDADGNNLYDKDINVTVDLANYFKGIRSVEWEVESPEEDGKAETGKIEVSASGQVSGDRSGYQILETDNNLVTHLQGKIPIRGNSNKICLHVVMTDRSGKQAEKELYLSIDKSSPQVSILFDKEHESSYYNEDRVATVTIKDKNFNPEGQTVFLQNAHGEVPKLSGWKRHKDNETYTATVLFDKDGLYAFSIEAKDLAGNTSKNVKAQSFTMDKTKPVIEVKLNQVKEKAEDIRYYKDMVQARVSISEYNFDINKVELTGTAKYQGNNLKYPKIHYIHSTRQSHEMVLEFEEEGEYSLRMKCTDNAGNVSESEQEYHFIIDKSAPQVDISGVEENKAYNGTVIPRIKVSDLNYKSQATKISLYDGKGETVEVHPKMEKTADGYSFVMDCFPKEKEYDQVYLLQVESTDMAGNITTKQVDFSVNRFGSSYEFDPTLKKAAGMYTNQEFNIVLTEINVSAIDHTKSLVRMICNDTVKDLKENQDYTVESSGGDGSWYTYRYQISKDLITEDGIYQFALYTKDEAGNINENSAEDKQALVWFGIDRTAPRVVPINVSNGGTYDETHRQVYINIDDNIKMNDVKLYVNGNETQYTTQGEQYVLEVGSSNQAQEIHVVATDLAGNATDRKVSDLYITTNFFVRVVHNRMVLTGVAIAACLAFAGALIVFIRYRRKQKSVMQ